MNQSFKTVAIVARRQTDAIEASINAVEAVFHQRGVKVLFGSQTLAALPGANGTYPLLSNNTWGPQQPNWSWNQGSEMYAQIVSGAERLQNGNTLVTDGTTGTLYEVDLSGEIVWKYVSPISNQGTITQGEEIPSGNVSVALGNAMFKARRYAPDFSAFSDKNMTPGSYLEHSTDACPDEEALPWDRNGDGCIDDSDNDGTNDPFDICQGHDDTVDIDNDTVPDGCDTLIDVDGDGVPYAEDVCEGFNDSIDSDADGVPDGCDARPNGGETNSTDNNTQTNQSVDNSTDNNTQTNQSVDNASENNTNASQPNEPNPLNETEGTVNTDSTSGKPEMDKATLSAAVLLFLGISRLLYYAATSIWKRPNHDSTPKQKQDKVFEEK